MLGLLHKLMMKYDAGNTKEFASKRYRYCEMTFRISFVQILAVRGVSASDKAVPKTGRPFGRLWYHPIKITSSIIDLMKYRCSASLLTWVTDATVRYSCYR